MSDNTDRVTKDLQGVIDELLPPNMEKVLEIWQRRLDYIKATCSFVGNTSEVSRREIKTLERCIKELRAACYIESGRPDKALELLIGPND